MAGSRSWHHMYDLHGYAWWEDSLDRASVYHNISYVTFCFSGGGITWNALHATDLGLHFGWLTKEKCDVRLRCRILNMFLWYIGDLQWITTRDGSIMCLTIKSRIIDPWCQLSPLIGHRPGRKDTTICLLSSAWCILCLTALMTSQWRSRPRFTIVILRHDQVGRFHFIVCENLHVTFHGSIMTRRMQYWTFYTMLDIFGFQIFIVSSLCLFRQE